MNCSGTTFSCFYPIIVFESLLCINRSYIVVNRKLRHFLDIYCWVSFLSSISLVIYKVTSDLKPDCNLLTFYAGVLFVEWIYFALSAKLKKNCFSMISDLDQFRNDEKYHKVMNKKVVIAVSIELFCIAVNILGVLYLRFDNPLLTAVCLGIMVHEMELIFHALLIETINLRISQLFDMSAKEGSRICHHILVAACNLNNDFEFKIMTMLGVTIFTTVMYIVIVVMESKFLSSLMVYLLWRELKTLYSLWVLCSAAYNTKKMWKKLAFTLSSRVALTKSSIVISSEEGAILRRWYMAVLMVLPSFGVGSDIQLGLATPIEVLDLSITYLVLFVQVYLAYKV